MAAMASGSVNLGVKGSPERAIGASVSPSLFSILGVQPLIGRTFLPEEAQPGRDREVVLSYGLWQRLFAGNRDVLGRTIDIDGAPMSIVGVMPAGIRVSPGFRDLGAARLRSCRPQRKQPWQPQP